MISLIIDAALGGLAVATAFREFQEGRDPGETPEQAAEVFAREMLAQESGEAAADDALAAYRSKRAQGTPEP